jgi:TAT (twin-arginine translocation) pathway signal sequence
VGASVGGPVDRRRFLVGSLAAGAGLALAGGLGPVASALAWPGRTAREAIAGRGARGTEPLATYPPMSYAPFAYSLTGLLQDGAGLATDVVNSVQLDTGPTYRFKLSWTPQTPNATGTLTFRANWIDKFWFALVFYPNGQVGFTNEDDGSFIDLARTYRPVDQAHPARFTLAVSGGGASFRLRDDAVPGSPVILGYTFPTTPLPSCLAVAHNTHAGTRAVWDFVTGTPG